MKHTYISTWYYVEKDTLYDHSEICNMAIARTLDDDVIIMEMMAGELNQDCCVIEPAAAAATLRRL